MQTDYRQLLKHDMSAFYCFLKTFYHSIANLYKLITIIKLDLAVFQVCAYNKTILQKYWNSQSQIKITNTEKHVN